MFSWLERFFTIHSMARVCVAVGGAGMRFVERKFVREPGRRLCALLDGGADISGVASRSIEGCTTGRGAMAASRSS
jgi:hypothetical protein